MSHESRQYEKLFEMLHPDLAASLLEKYAEEFGKEVAGFLSLVVDGTISLEKEDERVELQQRFTKTIEGTDNSRLNEIVLTEQEWLMNATLTGGSDSIHNSQSCLSPQELLILKKQQLRDAYERILHYFNTAEGITHMHLYWGSFFESMGTNMFDLLATLELSEETQKMFKSTIKAAFQEMSDGNHDMEIILDLTVDLSSPTRGKISWQPDLESDDVPTTSSSIEISPELLLKLVEHEHCTIYELVGVEKEEVDQLRKERNF